MIISICNEKGGVGKTTTAVQLGTLLAEAGQRTLIIDMDSQGHCGILLGLDLGGATTFDVLTDNLAIAAAIQPVNQTLWVLPSDKQLERAVVHLQGQPGADQVLRECLQTMPDRFDHIIIDCPPALGILTLNSLAASDAVVIPIVLHKLPFEGLKKVSLTIALVRKRTNPSLSVLGVLPVGIERTNVMADILAAVKAYCKGMQVFAPIPKSTKFAEAQCLGVPLQQHPRFNAKLKPMLQGYYEIIDKINHA